VAGVAGLEDVAVVVLASEFVAKTVEAERALLMSGVVVDVWSVGDVVAVLLASETWVPSAGVVVEVVVALVIVLVEVSPEGVEVPISVAGTGSQVPTSAVCMKE
jgi:hypothetical protein